MDLECQRQNILSAVKTFAANNSQSMLVFPPGDATELFMIHSAAEECGYPSYDFKLDK